MSECNAGGPTFNLEKRPTKNILSGVFFGNLNILITERLTVGWGKAFGTIG